MKIQFTPQPQRGIFDTSKKCFEFRHRPTGYDNPVQWEEPAMPGVRPSHPVSARGAVALEHKRSFPEKQHQETGIPPPHMCKAPVANEWGGWAESGAPGRRPLLGPWDSLEPEVEGAPSEFRFCDARTKRFPEMKYHDTLHLTRWHLDPYKDVDSPGGHKLHFNMPTDGIIAATPKDSAPLSARWPKAAPARLPAAGRPSGIQAGESGEAAPHTAR